MPLIQRPGIDHDPVKPWMWATVTGSSDPVEIVSFPIPHKDAKGEIDDRATIMIRRTPGDPCSLVEIPFKSTACFEPDRHEWFYRPKKYYSDNPTAFIFMDEN